MHLGRRNAKTRLQWERVAGEQLGNTPQQDSPKGQDSSEQPLTAEMQPRVVFLHRASSSCLATRSPEPAGASAGDLST